MKKPNPSRMLRANVTSKNNQRLPSFSFFQKTERKNVAHPNFPNPTNVPLLRSLIFVCFFLFTVVDQVPKMKKKKTNKKKGQLRFDILATRPKSTTRNRRPSITTAYCARITHSSIQDGRVKRFPSPDLQGHIFFCVVISKFIPSSALALFLSAWGPTLSFCPTTREPPSVRIGSVYFGTRHSEQRGS